MKCPRCDHDKTYVVKTTRPGTKAVDSVKQRRRVCAKCGDSFMTYEVNEWDFERLCDLIKSAGPTRRPLRTKPPEKPDNTAK